MSQLPLTLDSLLSYTNNWNEMAVTALLCEPSTARERSVTRTQRLGRHTGKPRNAAGAPGRVCTTRKAEGPRATWGLWRREGRPSWLGHPEMSSVVWTRTPAGCRSLRAQAVWVILGRGNSKLTWELLRFTWTNVDLDTARLRPFQRFPKWQRPDVQMLLSSLMKNAKN